MIIFLNTKTKTKTKTKNTKDMMSYDGLFFKAVAINGAQVDEEGQLVASGGWPIGAWFNYQKQNLQNPAKQAAVYDMLTQDGTNEIVKAKLDKFLASMH